MGKTAIQCPNCGAAAQRMEKDGTVHIVCEQEDTVFVVTRTGVKLQKTGGLADLERRVSALEDKETQPPDNALETKPTEEGENPPVDKGNGVTDEQGDGVTLTFDDEEE